MPKRVIKELLLIEDNPGDARLLREAFEESDSHNIAFTVATCMSDAERHLADRTFDIILLDLGLPDAQGLEGIRRAHAAAPRVPLVVLTGLEDELMATQSLQEGAQDYLIKGQLETRKIPRALRYALERKNLEEALFMEKERAQVTLRSIGDAVICTDISGNITFINAVAEKMTGWSWQEAVGQPMTDVFRLVDATSRETIPNRMELAVRRNETVLLSPNCLLIRRGGFETPIEDSAAPIHGHEEQAVGAVIVFRDVTERRRTEAQLRQAQKMEAIGNLTGGMAHDFNNLLGVIVGNLDLARERIGSDEELREMVSEALEAAWRGADLTRRLLAFARRQPLRPARIDVNELVTDTVRLLRRLLGEEIDISLRLAKDIWSVTADPGQLEASLTNLATNARDAMPKGGLLSITTSNRHLDAAYATSHADATEGDFVVIEVSDSGIGMSAEIINHIFEPFFTTKERGKGTGLGLSMVFGFLQQSGGHVNVHSEPDGGTTFRLYLPRMTAEVSAQEVPDLHSAASGAGETVLVVEDNFAMRRVVVRQLRELGYRVVESDRAAAAVEVLQNEPVDLLFTDIVMPGGLDGIELARLARERWPALKIVLTSGFPQTMVEKNTELLNSLRLLSKPYSKDELAAVLGAALMNARGDRWRTSSAAKSPLA